MRFSPGASLRNSEKCFPVETRALKTVPAGAPAPIFSTTEKSPSGVPSESLAQDGAARDVEMR